jgi:DNA-binding XRE family transcriptional regulator
LDRLSRDAHFLLGLEKAGVDFVAVDMPNANGVLMDTSERDREIRAARAAGVPLTVLAARHGVSKQRVSEIARRAPAPEIALTPGLCRRLRRAAGLTQEQLAAATGLQAVSIGFYERGRSRCGPAIWRKSSRYSGIQSSRQCSPRRCLNTWPRVVSSPTTASPPLGRAVQASAWKANAPPSSTTWTVAAGRRARHPYTENFWCGDYRCPMGTASGGVRGGIILTRNAE